MRSATTGPKRRYRIFVLKDSFYSEKVKNPCPKNQVFNLRINI